MGSYSRGRSRRRRVPGFATTSPARLGPPNRPLSPAARSLVTRRMAQWKMKRKSGRVQTPVQGQKSGMAKKPLSYGEQKRRTQRNWRRVGWTAAFLGALGLGWFLSREPSPKPIHTPVEQSRNEAPEKPHRQLPAPAPEKPTVPVDSTQPEKGRKPREKTPEERAAEQGEKDFNSGIKTVIEARKSIEAIAKERGLKFSEKTVWKYNKENPQGWKEVIDVNQLVYIGSMKPGEYGAPYFGIVISKNPLTFINQYGEPVSAYYFMPPGTYVQTIYAEQPKQ